MKPLNCKTAKATLLVSTFMALAILAVASSASAATGWWSVPVSTMKPNDGALAYDYVVGGCLFRISGGPPNLEGHFDAALQLPTGAVITRLLFDFVDGDPNNEVTAILFSATALLEIEALVIASSSGDSGSGRLIVPVSYVVDNASENLFVRVNFGNGTNSDLLACRVAVEYETADSVIHFDRFESGDTSAWDVTIP